MMTQCLTKAIYKYIFEQCAEIRHWKMSPLHCRKLNFHWKGLFRFESFFTASKFKARIISGLEIKIFLAQFLEDEREEVLASFSGDDNALVKSDSVICQGP